MKINNLSPDKLNKFFEVVDTCEGKVELVTSEGDRINLKSALCKYVAFANILVNTDIPEMEVICYNIYIRYEKEIKNGQENFNRNEKG